MTLTAGARLGPYEVLSALGAGGMGEVYRAKDTRLSREVAIKVLSAEVASDPSRLKRFEKEARAASALNHPNIVTIYEIGSVDAVSYIAMERVEGSTLRELLVGGPMPTKKLLQVATQIADGLAKAHEAGIVHRDLKPENVMVTKDGLVKILDFGLAKLTQSSSGSGEGVQLPSETRTSPGVVVGTASYMSPEQASGEEIDFRSDQFSFGSIFYEMATGKRAFSKKTGVDTLAAILNDDPEPITAINPQTPAPLRWVAERCLAKEPEGRYLSTGDLARDLSSLREHISELSSGTGIAIKRPRRSTRWALLTAILAGVASLAGMLFLGRRLERASVSQPQFRQLTFRGAGIGTARFAPDGQTIVFSSQTEGKPPELLSMRLDSPEVRPLGLPPAHVLSISTSGQMAILLLRSFALYPRIGHLATEQAIYRDPFLFDGTLAEASLGGGTPRELLEDVMFADWAPNGTDVGVVHRSGNRNRVEFPIGNSIYDDEFDVLNHPRISRGQARVAFKNFGGIFLKDPGGSARGLPTNTAFEIAWSGSTGELWSSDSGAAYTDIHAVTPSGRTRLVARLTGDYVLYDIAEDGRVLLGRLVESTEILGTFPKEPRERNLSHFDLSVATDLSPDGDTLLFADVFRSDAPSAGAPNSLYVRKTDGTPSKRLGDVMFSASALSRDGSRVLSLSPAGPDYQTRFDLIPTGPGETKTLAPGLSIPVTKGRIGFFPDGRSFFFVGAPKDGPHMRVWQQDTEGGKPRAITPEGVTRPVLVGDGHFICARGPDFQWHLYPVDENGETRKVSGILPGEEPIGSTPDGLLFVRGADELKPGETVMTTRVYRVDPATGQRELWKEIPPANPRTGGGILSILFSADGKTCVWTHIRYSTELVLVEGLK